MCRLKFYVWFEISKLGLDRFFCNFEIESVAVFSYFFDFKNFKVTDLAGVFDVRVFAGGFVKVFDFYDSDFLH